MRPISEIGIFLIFCRREFEFAPTFYYE